jgi:hypothetical protein
MLNTIYVKTEYLCFEDKITFFETTDDAVAFAQQESKGEWVNYCKVYVGGFLQYTYDFGRLCA